MDRARTTVLPQLKPRADDVLMARPAEGRAALKAMQAPETARVGYADETAPIEGRLHSPAYTDQGRVINNTPMAADRALHPIPCNARQSVVLGTVVLVGSTNDEGSAAGAADAAGVKVLIELMSISGSSRKDAAQLIAN